MSSNIMLCDQYNDLKNRLDRAKELQSALLKDHKNYNGLCNSIRRTLIKRAEIEMRFGKQLNKWTLKTSRAFDVQGRQFQNSVFKTFWLVWWSKFGKETLALSVKHAEIAENLEDHCLVNLGRMQRIQLYHIQQDLSYNQAALKRLQRNCDTMLDNVKTKEHALKLKCKQEYSFITKSLKSEKSTCRSALTASYIKVFGLNDRLCNLSWQVDFGLNTFREDLDFCLQQCQISDGKRLFNVRKIIFDCLKILCFKLLEFYAGVHSPESEVPVNTNQLQGTRNNDDGANGFAKPYQEILSKIESINTENNDHFPEADHSQSVNWALEQLATTNTDTAGAQQTVIQETLETFTQTFSFDCRNLYRTGGLELPMQAENGRVDKVKSSNHLGSSVDCIEEEVSLNPCPLTYTHEPFDTTVETLSEEINNFTCQMQSTKMYFEFIDSLENAIQMRCRIEQDYAAELKQWHTTASNAIAQHTQSNTANMPFVKEICRSFVFEAVLIGFAHKHSSQRISKDIDVAAKQWRQKVLRKFSIIKTNFKRMLRRWSKILQSIQRANKEYQKLKGQYEAANKIPKIYSHKSKMLLDLHNKEILQLEMNIQYRKYLEVVNYGRTYCCRFGHMIRMGSNSCDEFIDTINQTHVDFFRLSFRDYLYGIKKDMLLSSSDYWWRIIESGSKINGMPGLVENN